MKHIVCYSGGHSSALVAIEVFRKHGRDDLILLNHDISSRVEHEDIKRFKTEIADHIGIPITFANMADFEENDQFDVVIKADAFKVGNGTALCTNRLKTAPFNEWLKTNFADKSCVIYYGFDANEKVRIQRRSQILGLQGYKSDYPLALWDRTIFSTEEIGIKPPLTYSTWKHGNCIGCLKAGKQHWYCVYVLRPDIYKKGKFAEAEIGYTIHKGTTLAELEPLFERMKNAGIEPTERLASQTFWKNVRLRLNEEIDPSDQKKPCECIF
jgi:hypothetical protein